MSFVAVACLAAFGLQEPAAPAPTATALCERFHALDAAARTNVLRSLDRTVQRMDDAATQRIVAPARGRSAWPPAAPARWFAPADYAPAMTPRILVDTNDAAHREATRAIPHAAVVADFEVGVEYDWSAGKIVQSALEPNDEQAFANLVHGYPAGADEAIANVLAVLDTTPAQRTLAAYFDHLYADRAGHVFAGVTLFDAWSSGSQIEMPDTDVIAFARDVRRDRSYRSPVPADKRRDRLYESIRAAFAEHREYRSLRIALAATFVAADPAIDATWRNLVPRCHWIWAHCGDDPGAVAKYLAKSGDRGHLLEEIDAAMVKDSRAAERRRLDLTDLAEHLRRLADRETTRAGG